MLNITKKKVEHIRNTYKVGVRVKLENMEGENLPSGLEGTIAFVDDIGQIHVNWDNGSTLALDAEIDSFSLEGED